jgi:hypothetical protein
MIAKMISLDWRSMKTYQIRVLLLPVFLLIFGIYMPLFILPMSVFLLLSFSINPFAVEEKGELNYMYLTLPVSRNMIVSGRYILSLIMMTAGLILGSALLPLANMFSVSKWYIGLKGYLILVAISYLLYSFFNLCMFPVLFKIGYQKGKFIGFYLPAILFSVLFSVYSVLSYTSDNQNLTMNFLVWASENLILVSIILIIIATVLMLISYLLSLRFYSRRDF